MNTTDEFGFQDVTKPDMLGDEVSDAVSSATKVGAQAFEDTTNAFGSPHAAAPQSPPAAKQLDFGLDVGAGGVGGKLAAAAAPASPATPVMPTTSVTSSNMAYGDLLSGTSSAAAGAAGGGGDVDYNAFLRDTLLWVNKVRSAVYLVGGLLAIYLVHRLFTTQVTLVTGVCWALLVQLGLNFGRSFISPKLQERFTWSDSAWRAGAAHSFDSALRVVAAVHDAHLQGSNAAKTLRIIALLWLVSVAGRVASAAGLATLLWVAAFVVPKAYTQFQAQIDQVLGDVTTQVKDRFFGLDAKVRAALVIVPLIGAGYALSGADLGVALLTLAVYGKLSLAPAQMDKLNHSVTQPITNTVSKMGATVGHLMTQAAAKYELTPTPVKKKRA